MGLILSVVVLLLVPELRYGNGGLSGLLSRQHNSSDKLSYYQAVSRAAPAVVNIYSNSIDIRSSIFRRQQVERTSLGSGVVMTENGYILTCLHVIQNADSILVGMQDGELAEAEIVGQDRYTDLAVLKINAENLHVIPQIENPDIRIGDVVLAIGNPYNLGQTITQGIVSRTGRNFIGPSLSASSVDFIQTDAVLNEGNSGGALIDSNGNLIGINNANFKTLDSRRRVLNVDGVFFAVPYTLAKRVMDEIIAKGRASHGQLGFSGNTLQNQPGILVDTVYPSGPSALAGLRAGDVILAINGISVEDVNQALDTVANSAPGTILTLSVMRGEEALELAVQVAELGADS